MIRAVVDIAWRWSCRLCGQFDDGVLIRIYTLISSGLFLSSVSTVGIRFLSEGHGLSGWYVALIRNGQRDEGGFAFQGCTIFFYGIAFSDRKSPVPLQCDGGNKDRASQHGAIIRVLRPEARFTGGAIVRSFDQ